MGLFDKLKKTVGEKVQQKLEDRGIDTDIISIVGNARNLLNRTMSAVNEVRNAPKPQPQPDPLPNLQPKPQPASDGGAMEFKAENIHKCLDRLKIEHTVDSDGDIRIDFREDTITFERFVWIYVSPDCLIFDCGATGMPSNQDYQSVAERINHEEPDILAKINEKNKLRLNATIRASGYTTNDGERLAKDLRGTITHLVDLWEKKVWPCLGLDCRKPAINFSSEFVSKLLDSVNRKHTVDDDGDIRADYSSSKDVPFDWFIWYYPKGDHLIFDSGEKGIPRSADISGAVAELNAVKNGITVKVNSKGDPRLSYRLNAADLKDFGALSDAWNNIHTLMCMTWSYLASAAGLGKPDLEITTTLVTGALDNMKLKYTVDNDGDIRVNYSSSKDVPFDWFIWYYPRGSYLAIDSGEKGIPRSADISRVVSEINSGNYGMNVKITSDGDPRINSRIEVSDFGDLSSFYNEWARILGNIPKMWNVMATAAGLFRKEPVRTSSSSSRTSSSAASEAREAERRRKEKEKREKEERKEARDAERSRKEKEKREKEERKKLLADRISYWEGMIRSSERMRAQARQYKNQWEVQRFTADIATYKSYIRECKAGIYR